MAKDEEIQAALDSHRDVAAVREQNRDKKQDISPKQMLILLEVCERTGADLLQMMAVGEQESAHTWNDYSLSH